MRASTFLYALMRRNVHAPTADDGAFGQLEPERGQRLRLIGDHDDAWQGGDGHGTQELCIRIEDEFGV